MLAPLRPPFAKACLTFRYIKSGGAFRRVRFALACRTEPLNTILRQNSFLMGAFLSPLVGLTDLRKFC